MMSHGRPAVRDRFRVPLPTVGSDTINTNCGEQQRPMALLVLARLAAVVAVMCAMVSCTAAPAPAPPPVAPPAQAPIPSVVIGVVANNPVPFDVIRAMRAPVVRVEFAIGTDVAVIGATLDRLAVQGSSAVLLAGFYRSIPTEAQAQALGTWARTFGPASGRRLPVRTIEFGNETSYTGQYGDEVTDASYTERASTYALRAAVAARSIRAADPGVGLIAQADDGGTRSSAWVDSMFAAVPDLDLLVAGWVVHPYGPTYDERLQRTRAQLTAHDAAGPLWLTEWGVATDDGQCLDDNYGWNPCMDNATAASLLRAVVADVARYDVAGFFVYQATDQSPPGGTDKEDYFGVVKSDGRAKGEYTDAVRALFAAGDPLPENSRGR